MITIDKKNLNDPNKVSIFAKDIFEYYIKNESKYLISSNEELSDFSTNRINCINVMQKFINCLKFTYDTFNLSVYLFDFYLFKIEKIIQKTDYKYLIITCLYMAAKFFEINLITLNYILSFIGDKENIDRKRIINLECLILEKNNYILNKIDDKDILKRIILMEGYSENIYLLASFLLEISIYSTNYFKYMPSVRAIASIFISLELYRIKFNIESLKSNINYNENENKIEEYKKIILDSIDLNNKIELAIVKKFEKNSNSHFKNKMRELFTIKLI